jgi:uncharacterized membrane protein YdjX (TVP38/TMEM64 family)
VDDSPLRLRRVAALVVLVAAAGLVVASDTLHARLADAVAWGEALITRAPMSGMAMFVVLSALSAVFAFFSSSLLAPVAVATWGTLGTLALLWLGWLLGGVVTYAVGRYVGRSAAALFVDDATLARWEQRVSRHVRVSHMLLVQLAMPTEILGYVLGLVRYSFGTYVAILAVTEIPYAIAVVYLGESFLAGNAVTFVLIGLAVVSGSAALIYLVRRDVR